MTHIKTTYAKAQNNVALTTLYTMCSDHEIRVTRFQGMTLLIQEGWEFDYQTLTLNGTAINGDEYRIAAENIREVEVLS